MPGSIRTPTVLKVVSIVCVWGGNPSMEWSWVILFVTAPGIGQGHCADLGFTCSRE